MRDPTTGNSKGFAFINFSSFDASDAAIEAMNGQYLCNRPITISYAFKKDSKGERHGSAAERLLAAQNPLAQTVCDIIINIIGVIIIHLNFKILTGSTSSAVR